MCAEAIDLIAGQKKEALDGRASTQPCLQEAVEGRGWTAGIIDEKDLVGASSPR